jgi:UDP-N-acetylmuramoyl-tripeptide--D-alanyl-D-alanine ligase
MKDTLFFEFMNKTGISVENKRVKSVVMDSNKIEEGDVFVAIRGGNGYINEAFKAGASFVIYDKEDIEHPNKNAVKVKNSIEFLQEFAKYYRENLNIKVIGITGSNGKTTTKDILYTILSSVMNGKKTEGNYNNHIGLPFTILRAEEEDKFIILEMGMSGLGEIELLAKIAQPDYGIITNIGHSHLEQLKTRENIFKAKTEIVPFIKKSIVVSGDDEFLYRVEGIKAGLNSENDYYAEEIESSEEKSTFTLNANNKKYKVITNLTGEHNIVNVIMGIACAVEAGVEIEKCIEAVKEIVVSKMRFEKIEKDGIIYINDAYNASPMSMKCSIETFSGLYNDKIKIAVLGDMLELGDESSKLHREIKKILEKSKIDIVMLYGKMMRELYEELGEKALYFVDKSDIKAEIKRIAGEKAVLLKGSRGMKLEEVI